MGSRSQFVDDSIFTWEPFNDAPPDWPSSPLATPTPPPFSEPELQPQLPALPTQKQVEAEEAKVLVAAMAARRALSEHCFAHLTHSQSRIDWTIEGRYVCRIRECKGLGVDHYNPSRLQKHLHRDMHLNLDRAMREKNPPKERPQTPSPPLATESEAAAALKMPERPQKRVRFTRMDEFNWEDKMYKLMGHLYDVDVLEFDREIANSDDERDYSHIGTQSVITVGH